MAEYTYQVMPDLSEEEFAELKASIAEHGVMIPIELDECGNVLDGHHRLRACEELGITDYPTVVREGMTEQDKLLHAFTLNTARRHLTHEQKAAAISEIIKRDPTLSNRKIAKAVGVSHPTIGKYRKQLEDSGQVEKVTTCTGEDGKVYPTERNGGLAPSQQSTLTESPFLKWQCCICKQYFPVRHYASGRVSRSGINNAWPLSMTGYCCDHCDEALVLPSRIVLLMTKDEDGIEAMNDLERKLLATDEITDFSIDANGMPDYEYPRAMAVLDVIGGRDATSFAVHNEAVRMGVGLMMDKAEEIDTVEAWEIVRDTVEDVRQVYEDVTQELEAKEAALREA